MRLALNSSEGIKWWKEACSLNPSLWAAVTLFLLVNSRATLQGWKERVSYWSCKNKGRNSPRILYRDEWDTIRMPGLLSLNHVVGPLTGHVNHWSIFFLVRVRVDMGFETPCESSILAFSDTEQFDFGFQQGQHIRNGLTVETKRRHSCADICTDSTWGYETEVSFSLEDYVTSHTITWW